MGSGFHADESNIYGFDAYGYPHNLLYKTFHHTYVRMHVVTSVLATYIASYILSFKLVGCMASSKDK